MAQEVDFELIEEYIVQKSTKAIDELDYVIVDPEDKNTTINNILDTFGRTKDRGVLFQIGVVGEEKPLFIGKSSSTGIRTRLSQHLYGLSIGKTVPKYNKVKEMYDAKKSVWVKFIVVKPKLLVSTIESELVHRIQPEWNEKK